MVSRRNFISIILMMAVLFFMFQFSQVIKIRGNDYNINEYINEETSRHPVALPTTALSPG